MNKSYLKYYCILGLLCLFTTFTLQIGNFIPNQNFELNEIDFSETNIVSDGFNNSYWNDGLSMAPSITVDNTGKVHMVWWDFTLGIWSDGESEIMYASYTDELGWSNTTIISDGYNDFYWNEDESTRPSIAVDNSGKIHVVWDDDTNGVWGWDSEIMYTSYTEGLGWSNATVISDGFNGSYWNDGYSLGPSIAIDNSGNLHVIWEDATEGTWGYGETEIMYASSSDGIIWTNAIVISDGYDGYYWNDDFSSVPSINVDNSSNIHVVWEDSTDGTWGIDESEIMYVNYTDVLGWSNATVISDGFNGTYWNDENSDNPSITFNNGTIHVVWGDSTDGIWGTDREIMYAFSLDGITWSNVTIISDGYEGYYWNDGISISPSIVADNSSNLHVVWSDGTYGIWGTDVEVMYAFFSEEEGWSNVTIVSDDETGWNNGDSYIYNIDIDSNGKIYTIWEDNSNGIWGSDSEIMYVAFTNVNYIISIKPDFSNVNLLLSIFFLSSIAFFLYIEGDSEKKKKNLRKTILIYICNLSLSTSLISLQIYEIDVNAKRGIELFEDPIKILFPFFLLILSVLILIIISISLVISLQEYKSYLRMRNQEIISHRNLTFERIFENKIRQRIINMILSMRAVHFKQLLRDCGLQTGQLQWHLKILLEFKIIKKKNIDNFTVFFPNLRSDTFEEKYLSVKSKIGMDILDEIEKNPGIIQSELADNLDLGRPNINYYIKKLKNKQLVKTKKEGREIKLFLN